MSAPSPFHPTRICLVINPLSGSVEGGEEKTIARMLQERGMELSKTIDISRVNGHWSASELKELQEIDAVICLSGDGTLKAVLQASPVPVLPLPGGTLNLLPYAVTREASWQEVLTSALETPKCKALEAVRLGGEMFFVRAHLGSSAHFGKARERVREGLFRATLTHLKRSLLVVNRQKIYYQTPESAKKVGREFVLMLKPGSAALSETGTIETAVFGKLSLSMMADLGKAALGTGWRASDTVDHFLGTRFDVRARRPISALLDGEYCRLPAVMRVELIKDAARVWYL